MFYGSQAQDRIPNSKNSYPVKIMRFCVDAKGSFSVYTKIQC